MDYRNTLGLTHQDIEIYADRDTGTIMVEPYDLEGPIYLDGNEVEQFYEALKEAKYEL